MYVCTSISGGKESCKMCRILARIGLFIARIEILLDFCWICINLARIFVRILQVLARWFLATAWLYIYGYNIYTHACKNVRKPMQWCSKFLQEYFVEFIAGSCKNTLQIRLQDLAEVLQQKLSQDLARILQDCAGFLQEKVLFYCKNRNPTGFLLDLHKSCRNLARLTSYGSCRFLQDGFYWESSFWHVDSLSFQWSDIVNRL